MRAMLQRRWWVIGLLLGAALVAALIAPVAGSDGLDRLAENVPLASARASRIAVAGAAVLLGLILARILRSLARPREDTANQEAAEMRHVAPSPSGDHLPAVARLESPVPVAWPAATEPAAAPSPQPAATSGAPSPDGSAWPRSSREPSVDSDHATTAAIARIEAALADLTAHGAGTVGARLEAIDARMGQLAQQIAEVAALARAAARTPSLLPAALAQLPGPTDPGQRRAIGAAARALRERLGPSPEPF